MGADLYAVGFEDHQTKLKPQWDKAIEKRNSAEKGTPAYTQAQAEAEELWDIMYNNELYFRDSYNDSSVLWRCGLSWWADMGEVSEPYDPVTNPHGVNMPPAQCLALAKRVEEAELKLVTPEEFAEKFDNGDDTIEDWNNYFIEKRAKLVRFLKTAAAHGGMEASV